MYQINLRIDRTYNLTSWIFSFRNIGIDSTSLWIVVHTFQPSSSFPYLGWKKKEYIYIYIWRQTVTINISNDARILCGFKVKYKRRGMIENDRLDVSLYLHCNWQYIVFVNRCGLRTTLYTLDYRRYSRPCGRDRRWFDNK